LAAHKIKELTEKLALTASLRKNRFVSIYSDLNSAFDIVLRTLPSHKISACEVSDGYGSSLRNYVTSRYSFLGINGIY
jgi:hypothetical protein